MREKLSSCQSLLNCKRDDLKRLWLESIENKFILEQLDAIDQQIKVPEKVTEYLKGKRYLHATELLINCLSHLEGNLKTIEGLTEIKNDLISKKEEMFNLFLDDLHRHIYVKSTSEVLKKIKRTDASSGERLRSTVSDKASLGVSVAEILSNGIRNPASLTSEF
jgi:exocyst complex component 4